MLLLTVLKSLICIRFKGEKINCFYHWGDKSFSWGQESLEDFKADLNSKVIGYNNELYYKYQFVHFPKKWDRYSRQATHYSPREHLLTNYSNQELIFDLEGIIPDTYELSQNLDFRLETITLVLITTLYFSLISE